MVRRRERLIRGILFSFSLGVLLCAFPGLAQAGSPPVFVQYHLLFTYGDEQLPGFTTIGPNYGRWHMWSQTTAYAEVENGVPPTQFRSPWRRVLASRLGLPLTGPYSSGAQKGTVSEEVLSYHFTLVKQAGIDGLFASLYDGNWEPIARRHMDIAQSVGMKIGLEIYHSPWGFHCDESEAVQQDRRKDYLWTVLRRFKNHPAYLKIDGKTVVWIANIPTCNNEQGKVFTWGNKAQLKAIFDWVESKVGPFYVVMTGPPTDDHQAPFSEILQILKIITAENINLFWSLFGHDHQIHQALTPAHRQNFERAYQEAISQARQMAGSKLALHVYPAFDERGLFPTRGDRQSGIHLPRTVIGRDGSGMYPPNDGFLKAALDKAKANDLWVFLESWNDWNEQTQIEPGFHFDGFSRHGDSFSPLRRVAEFKGRGDVAFPYPPTSILDPPLKKYCRYKEWEGASVSGPPDPKVILKGRLGLGHGANSCTNGVALSVFYLDPNGTWKPHTTVQKNYNGQLMNLNIDLTPLLDKPAISLGIESMGSPNCDWAYLVDLKLDWNGQQVNLLDESILRQFHWKSQAGPIPWGNNNPSGTVTLASNVRLEDNQSYPRALYLHPNWKWNGFVRGEMKLSAIPTPKRVELRGKIGLGHGADACTNGVAFMVSYLDDDRSNQNPSHLPATNFIGQAFIEKKYTGQLKDFRIDLTRFLDKPGIVFGIESLGSPNCDWAYLPELKLNWYGQEINLLESEILQDFNWHSQAGGIPWGNNNPSGSAVLFPNVRLEDNRIYPNALYLHPNWNPGGFVHAGLDFWALAPYIQECD